MKLKLKEIRRKSHVSQEELAKRIGVSSRAIGAWERSENAPNAEQVWNCAVALGSTPNDVMGWYDEHPEDRPASPPADPMASDLVRHFSNLSEEGREVAVNVLAGMESTYPQGDGSPGVVEEAV